MHNIAECIETIGSIMDELSIDKKEYRVQRVISQNIT